MKLDKQSKERLAKTYNFTKWIKPESAAVLSGATVSAVQLPGYDLISTRKMSPADGVVLHHLLWSHSGEARVAVSLQLYETRNAAKARDLLLYLLGQFEGPPLEPLRPAIGEVAFSTKGQRLVIFGSQNLVFVITNAGDKPVGLSPFLDGVRAAVARDQGGLPRKPSKVQKRK
jgi:hypothetical protein